MVEEEGRHRGLRVLRKEVAADVAEMDTDCIDPGAGRLVVDHILEVVRVAERHRVAAAAGRDCESGEDMVAVGAAEGMGCGMVGHEEEGAAGVGSRAAVGAAGRIGLEEDNLEADRNLEEVQVVEHRTVVVADILGADIDLAGAVRSPGRTCCVMLGRKRMLKRGQESCW